ncbi:DNA repair protein RAD51 -like protein [Trametes pubescens]|uniref:DNA repair protein RAD51-like protein n=1 Tax=Trametes pubescens TaxID=154538 RepID=A0A1M2V6K6_TRAPU|nr:DNA repair protein RAD51 -like protein [Trametes pubescens]
MRLQHFSPPIQNELVQALQEIGIRTDTDLLLSEDPTKIFMRLPQDLGISLLDFRRAVAKVAEMASATPTYGDKLLQQELKRQEDIFADDMRIGVPALDALLGGFSPPRVIEVSGDKGSRKTALALQLSLRHLAQVRDSSVLWIDSNGEFSPERVSMMLGQMEGELSPTILERLQVSLAFDVEAVHEVLESLRQTLSSRSSFSELPTTRCIVIDSITPLLGPMLSATSSQGHAIMTTFMRQLRAFADSFLLTILVINSSTKILPSNPETVFETARKPALGPSFTFMADATLWLSQRPPEEAESDDDSTVHIAEVLRSRISRSKTWAQFKIKNGLLVSV